MAQQQNRGPKKAGALQKLSGLFLLFSGAGIFVAGLLLLLAALNANQANHFLNDWAVTGQQPSPKAFAVAEAAAIRAIRLYPGQSGEHWDRLGRIYDWRHWQAPISRNALATVRPSTAQILEKPLGVTGSTEPGTTRARAIAAYEKAVQQRPLWPYGIARLASARLRAGGIDQELAELLKEAHQLGPWRPVINRRITEIGLKGWGGLDQEARDIVLENARRTVSLSRADERWVRQLGEQTGLGLLLSLMVLP